jgi:hypothetical protein
MDSATNRKPLFETMDEKKRRETAETSNSFFLFTSQKQKNKKQKF